MDNRPIGMFDSGCGGLTVLKEFIKKMPHEDFIYYGDTAHLPYGDKSKEKIIEYSDEIVQFLLKKNVKMIIIACGTASASAYEFLSQKYHNITIQNIIEPTAIAIQDNKVGVIATKTTIRSNAWENAILKYHPDSHIISKACPLLVPLIEEGFIENPATNSILTEYLNTFIDMNQQPKITSLILGCTHYPMLSNQIQKILGESVHLINVGSYTATSSYEFLEKNSLQNDPEHTGGTIFYSSDDYESFKENAKMLNFKI